MMKEIVRAITNSIFMSKVLIAFVIVVVQFVIANQGDSVQAQNEPSVDFPSLAGKSMGDIIKQINKLRRCRELNEKEVLSRLPPNTQPYDDICYFKIGGDLVTIGSYRGRAVAFSCAIGAAKLIHNKMPIKPEGALLHVGINVNGTKPSQVIQDPTVVPYQTKKSPPPLQEGEQQHYVWSGTFNGKSWKELRVVQLPRM